MVKDDARFNVVPFRAVIILLIELIDVTFMIFPFVHRQIWIT